MTTTMKAARMDSNVAHWLDRIRAEYREMPGLSLTPAQMQRLWGFEPHVCAALVDSLVADRVLRRTVRGSYVAHADCLIAVSPGARHP